MTASKIARVWGVSACVLGVTAAVSAPLGCSDIGDVGTMNTGGGGQGNGGNPGAGGNTNPAGGMNAMGGSTATGGAGASNGGVTSVAGSGGVAAGGTPTGGSGGAAGAGGGAGGSAAGNGNGGSGGGAVSFAPCSSAPAGTVPALKRGPAITGFTGMMTAGQMIGVPGEANTLYVIGHRDGNVFIVQDGKAAGTLTKVTVASGGNNEQGLLSMAFHPQFATNHLFYLFYTAAGGDMTIDEFERLTPTTAMKKQNIYSQPRAGGGMFHNGGFISFNPKDAMPYLYFSVGNNESNDAGNPEGVAGRVHRIDVGSKAHTTFAYGLRNPYRMSIDRLTGDMFIADVANGPGGTIIFNPFGTTGKDYGYRNNNGNPDVNNGILRDSSGAAIIGGFVYRGNKIPGLCGRYFYGNHDGGAVHSIVVSGGQKMGATADHGTLSVPGNITSFGEDGEGELYMASMSNTIYKIVAGP